MSEEKAPIGLAGCPEMTRKRVGSAGANAPHKLRGLAAASEETRRRVASKGGQAKNAHPTA